MNPRDEHINIGQQLWELFAKYGLRILWILVGLIGMFSADLIRNKKFTRWYILGCTGCAIFIGYLSCSYCMTHYPDQAPILVPLATMLSNNLVSALIAIDYKALMQKDWKGAFDLLTRKKD